MGRISVPAPSRSSSAGVSRSMKSNRRRDTSPELRLRSALHARGWRFRADVPISGLGRRSRPDIAFTRWRVAVFVDGCFWHGCPLHGVPPKTNTGYWSAKLARNAQRDREDVESLEGGGWAVLRIWEHVELADAVSAVEAELSAQGASPRTALSR